MGLQNYDPIVKSIDKLATSFNKHVRLPYRPIVISQMNDLNFSCNPRRKVILYHYAADMTRRTARALGSFADPAIRHTLEQPKSERLRWGHKVSEREFKFCCVLEDSAKRYVADGFKLNGPLAAAGQHGGASSVLHLRNSDDLSYIDDVVLDEDVDHDAASGDESGRVSGKLDMASLTREEVERALNSGQILLSDIPYDIALEVLRPDHAVLDTMVNESPIRSPALNNWFALFCRRRVAWRTIHEHLLHLTNPHVFPRVINVDTSVLDILERAASEVMDAFYSTENRSADLTIDIVEDDAALAGPPPLSSTMRHVPNGTQPAVTAPDPPTSDTVHTVEGHLLYVVREALKNACVASCAVSDDIRVVVRFAIDAQWVVIEVSDSAGGIPPAYHDKVWQFGWTSNPADQSALAGFGVGLPTSKVYMDLWGGALDLYTSATRGTTIRIQYPKKPTEVVPPTDTIPFLDDPIIS